MTMSGETPISISGNLTSDPELRFTQSGLAVASFTVASTPRKYDRASETWKDGETLFLRCSVWRAYAEHVAASLGKGSAVLILGTLRTNNYETKEGEKRHGYEVDVDEIGPTLRYATAVVTRVASGSASADVWVDDAVQPAELVGAKK